MRKWILISTLALSVIFCNLAAPKPVSTTPTLDVDFSLTVISAASASAEARTTLTPQAETPPPGVPEMGTITGALSYPSEAIPPLRIAAFEVTTGEVSYIDTAAGQSAYTFDLPAGTYHVVAYMLDGALAGGYSRAVPCGLAVECADHALLDVTVLAGEITSGVDPGDWYAQEGDFPPMPEQ